MKTSMYYSRNNLILFAGALTLLVLYALGFAELAGAGSMGLAMAAAGKVEIESLRKITLGTIGVQPDIEELLKKEGKRMDLADIYGVATKAKPGTSDFGPYVAFLGDFRAVRLADKAAFSARKIILPRFIEEEMFSMFDESGNGNVEFAFRISAKYDKEAATKYTYDMKPLIKAKENAQLSNLEKAVTDAVKALPAPAK